MRKQKIKQFSQYVEDTYGIDVNINPIVDDLDPFDPDPEQWLSKKFRVNGRFYCHKKWPLIDLFSYQEDIDKWEEALIVTELHELGHFLHFDGLGRDIDLFNFFPKLDREFIAWELGKEELSRIPKRFHPDLEIFKLMMDLGMDNYQSGVKHGLAA